MDWRKFGRLGGTTANGHAGGAAPANNGGSTSDTAVTEAKGKQRALDEPLWGLENFGNTCYCNSILQALFSSEPFRAFVESYPDVSQPYNALGGAIATGPIQPDSPEDAKPNPLEATPVTPPTKEKRGGLLGLGKKQTPAAKQPATPAPAVTQAQPPPVILPPDPNFPEMTLFSTIQTLFHHMSTSAPHHPAAPKTPAPANGTEPATNATGSNAASLPSASLVQGLQPGQVQGPSLLASLPAPSTVRGGGPYSAGTLGRGVVRPEDVLRTVRRHHLMFAGQGQQDAHEFLGFILNQLAEEVETIDARLKENGQGVTTIKEHGKTFINSLFHGVLVNETRCLNCETTSAREESFLDLSIDIEQHSSLTACLRQFSHSEMLCSTNKFYCETCCGLVEAERRMRIKSLPNILGLHLKRFRQDEMGRLHKLFYRVTFPLSLRVPCTTEDTEDAERLYELFAVVVHIGNGPTHGHYVTVVRSEGKWVMCDDENIEPIEEDDLANYFGDNITGAGYVLFYQAVDLDLLSLGLKKLPEPRILPPTPTPEAVIKMTEGDVQERPVVSGHANEAPASVPVATPTVPSPNPSAPTKVSPISSSSGTPDSSVRRMSSSATGRPESRFFESPPVRPDPSNARSPQEKSKWYSLKRKDGAVPERGTLRRQSTATTLNTVDTAHTASTDMEPTPVDMSSSMMSTQSGTSAGSAQFSQFSGSAQFSQFSSAQASTSAISAPPPVRPTRVGPTASVPAVPTAANGYAGGGNLGRKLSDRTGLGKLTRSSSSAWKMGFGKKGKEGRVEE